MSKKKLIRLFTHILFFFILFEHGYSQNIGVGTNTPTASLDVNGTFRLRNNAATGKALISDNEGNATWQNLPSFNDIIFAGSGLSKTGDTVKLGDAYFKYSTSLPYNMPIANTGNALTGLPRIFLGDNVSSGDNSALLIGRHLTGTGLFVHAIRDESDIDGEAYASYDAIATMTGAGTKNHFHAFQARPQYFGSGVLPQMAGYTFQGLHTGTGTINSMIGAKISDAQGNGNIDYQIGLYIENLTKGNGNFAIYSAGSTPSYHGGLWQTGSDIIAAGNLRAQNFISSSLMQSVSIGNNINTGLYIGYYLSNVGYGAGHSLLTANNTHNTLLGYSTGYNITNGSSNTIIGSQAGYYGNRNGNVLIGAFAGKWLERDSLFIIDNQDRGSPYADSSKALVYGTFSKILAKQSLSINGKLKINDGSQGRGRVLTSDASGNATWQPQQVSNRNDVLSIGSTEFRSGTSNFPITNEDDSKGTFSTGQTFGKIKVPLHVPNEARIKSIVFWFKDNSNENFTFEIRRVSNNSDNINSSLTVMSNGVSSEWRSVTISPTNYIIDNTSYTYYLSAVTNWSGNPDTAIKSIVIQYTY